MNYPLIALVLGGLLAGAGCSTGAESTLGPGPSPTSTVVTDMAGRTVSLRRPIKRIVLIRSRDIYELSLLLGAAVEDRVVAWGDDIQSADADAYAAFLKQYPRLGRIPLVGSIFQDALSAEQVLALKPDLVVADTFMIDRRYKSMDQLGKAGLPVLFLNLSDDPFKGPQQSLLLLGTVLGCEPRAREIVAFADAEIAAVVARLDRIRTPPPSVYLESGSAGAGTYGSTYGRSADGTLSSWGHVLDRVRCRNIASDVASGMARISPEYLIAKDPDVIVITGAGWPALPDTMRLGYSATPADSSARLRAFAKRPGWEHLQAVRSGRVYGLFHGFCMHPTSFVALQQMAKWLYPAEFQDLRPEERLREFHRRFMPIAFSGVWAAGLEAAP